jgi:formylglycine-generating enzyme required for sulfatase activity
VADERALALSVLDQLQYDPLLRGKITIEIVAWDKPGAGAPMLATLTPQEAIKKGLPTPAECDVVIVIFWARMGTPLPDDWKKTDGSRYLSGTEWEYLNALKAAEKNGEPAILVYHRTEKIILDPDDPDRGLKLEQWDQVKQFFQSFTNPDGSIKRGYNSYRKPDEFKEQLHLHLRAVVRDILDSKPSAPATPSVSPAHAVSSPPLWPDSPFPGLRAFTPDDAPIFFGRGQETDGLVDKLADSKTRFLAVVGASGSGKSSLVAAGLIPRLKAGAIPGSQDWICIRFSPGEVGDNPFLALAQPFKEALQKRRQQPRELADRLETDLAATLIELRDLALTGRPDWAELLLFVDQFEELFTLVAPRYVDAFVEWLYQAAQTARLRVVATLRADFYHRCAERAPLAALLRDGSYPLAAPGVGALREMIARPAERAGLRFEPKLDEQILNDTGIEPGRLALLAFALAELYAMRTDAGCLTWAAYEGFGRVAGAIAKRAEDTVSKLGVTEKTVGEVFRKLVEFDKEGTVTRRRAPRARLVESVDAERLVKAFVDDARLLVASRGENGQPVVEVAHETLFAAWKTLRDWIANHREQLKAGQDLEDAALEWHNIGEHGSGLASGVRFKRYCRAVNPSDLAARFLRASRRRLWILRGVAGTVAGLVLAIMVGTFWLYANGLTIKHGTSMVLATVGLYRVSEPEMVRIEAGEFWMGSREDDQEARDSEKPRHRVTIPRPFEIGKYEITFDEYDQFAYATGQALPADQGWGRGRRPVINVSWEDAVAYAAWLSKMTGKAYRLPTEAEWEYAARAGSEAARFWGDDAKQACQYANGADRSFRQAGYSGEIHDCDDGYVFTAEVGSFKASRFKANPFGLYNTLGNVWEWVQDSWHDDYQGAPVDDSAWEENAGGPRVLRGGSWSLGPARLRSAARFRFAPRFWTTPPGSVSPGPYNPLTFLLFPFTGVQGAKPPGRFFWRVGHGRENR